MKAILRKSKTDDDMIEIITIHNGKEWLWGVVHADFIQNEDIQKEYEQEMNLNVEIKADEKI